MFIHAWALVRGKSETDGLHERVIEMGPVVRTIFLAGDPNGELKTRSRAYVEAAKSARVRVLRPAILALLQGGPDELDFSDKRADRLLGPFDAEVDAIFFECLFGSFEDPAKDDPSGTKKWHRHLLDSARKAFMTATRSVAYSSATRWRAIARGEMALEGSARKRLPEAFERT